MYVQSSLAVKKSLAEICHFKSVKMVCRSLQILDPVLRKKKLEKYSSFIFSFWMVAKYSCFRTMEINFENFFKISVNRMSRKTKILTVSHKSNSVNGWKILDCTPIKITSTS